MSTLTGTIVELQKTFPFQRVEFGVILRAMERFGTSQVMGKKLASRKGKPSFVWKVEVAPLKALLGIENATSGMSNNILHLPTKQKSDVTTVPDVYMAPIDVILVYAVFLSENKKEEAAKLELETESFFGKGKLHNLVTGAVGLSGPFHQSVKGVGVLPGILYSREALRNGIHV